MTDLGDKSQVISCNAEAMLTKEDLPQDGLPGQDDSGAPLDFSSSLSSAAGHPPPSADDKGKVHETPPQSGVGEDTTSSPDDPDSLEKQYEFAQFNQKFLPPEDGATFHATKPPLSLVPGTGGHAEGEAAPDPAVDVPEGGAARHPTKPLLSLVPGEGGCASVRVTPCTESNPREPSLVPDPGGGAASRGTSDPVLPDAELLVDIAENI